MVIEPDNTENIKLNVYLKNGEKFIMKDTTSNPIGQLERIIAFWHEGKIMVYPMAQIDHVEMVF